MTTGIATEAGLDLDALVERHVMGFIWDEKRCRICGWPLATELKLGCLPDNCSLRPAPEQMADVPAKYSTDLMAAMSVLEKFEGYAIVKVCRDHPAMGIKAGQTQVTVWTGMTSEPVWAVAGSVPLAICRAALKAKGL